MPGIFVRTFATDNNPAGGSEFLPITVPVGVRDGDIIIVGITFDLAGLVVTPPSDEWTKIAQTDATISLGIVAFWKLALSEPTHWVFATNASVDIAGGAVVYANPDPFLPVEVSSIALTAASATHAVGGLTASVNNEELLLLLGADAVGTYTPQTGSIEVESTSNTLTFAAHRRPLTSAGAVAASTITFSTPADGATMLLALRPGVGQFSLDDVRQRIIEALPEGVDDVLDLTPSGDYYKYFGAIAALLKVYGYDLVDLVEQEIRPTTSYHKLPDWERIFGLETTRIAQTGTIPERQTQVLAALRRAAGVGSSIPEVQAAVAPLLGYTNTSDLEILETPRDDLTTAHTYAATTPPVAIPGPGSVACNITVADDTAVSQAGAQVILFVTHAAAEDLSITLSNPGAQLTKTWAAGSLGSGALISTDERRLYAPEFADLDILGTWILTVISTGAAGTLEDASIFVEGIGRTVTPGGYEGLGSAIFEWGPFIDPTKVNAGVGGAVDYKGVRLVVESFAQSHTLGTIIRGSETISPGDPLAIPDDPNTIPNEVIPS